MTMTNDILRENASLLVQNNRIFSHYFFFKPIDYYLNLTYHKQLILD